MKLGEGTRFVILGLSDTVILRKTDFSQERIRLKQLLAKSREKANKIGFTQQEVDRLIESSRKVTE